MHQSIEAYGDFSSQRIFGASGKIQILWTEKEEKSAIKKFFSLKSRYSTLFIKIY